MRPAVDERDQELVDHFTWWWNGRYFFTQISGRTVYLHRLLMLPDPGLEVDHLDGDGANNRRENLRICTHKENSRNNHGKRGSSQFKGVHRDKTRQKWAAFITVNYKSVGLGRYDSEEDAARAYDAAAQEHFGSFAVTNFGAV